MFISGNNFQENGSGFFLLIILELFVFFRRFPKAAGYLQNFVLAAIIKPTILYMAVGNGHRYHI